ncbi:MAG TPA: hypothetical protein VES65_05305 [Solirubrobacteraceae bacterium]|nr:hypothetical protein [Solirubrobacteraceae bacterium]
MDFDQSTLDTAHILHIAPAERLDTLPHQTTDRRPSSITLADHINRAEAKNAPAGLKARCGPSGQER